METTGNTKHANAEIRTTKLARKYFLETMVSSAKQKVSMHVILGLSHQLIQLRQSGFNADQKSKQLIIRRVTPFLTSDLTVTYVIFHG